MKTQKENDGVFGGTLVKQPSISAGSTLDGQLSLMDILNNVDDGTYGKPVEEFEV